MARNFKTPAGIVNLTTAERDIISAPEHGALIYNTTTVQFEYYDSNKSPMGWYPIIDTDNIVGTPLGSIDEHSDVDTTTLIPDSGDSLIWDGFNWVPSSTSAESSNNYVFAYTTATQSATPVNTYLPITYEFIDEIDGWTYGSPFDGFISAVTGLFAATVEVNVQRAGGGGGAVTSDVICRIYGGSPSPREVTGSHNGVDITSNNTAFSNSRTFLFNIVQGETFKVEWSGSSTSVQLTPGPSPAGASSTPSSTVTIRRLT